MEPAPTPGPGRSPRPARVGRPGDPEGDLVGGQQLSLTAACDELVLFGDGVESDAVTLAWGQTARVGVAARTLNLLR